MSLHFSVEGVYITCFKFAGRMFIYGYICLLIDRTCKFCGTVTSLRDGWHPEESSRGGRDFVSSKIFRTASWTHAPSRSVVYLGLFPGVISPEREATSLEMCLAIPPLHHVFMLPTPYGLEAGNRIPVVEMFSALDETGPGAHTASYTMVTGSFQWVERPGCCLNHPPHLAWRLKKE